MITVRARDIRKVLRICDVRMVSTFLRRHAELADSGLFLLLNKRLQQIVAAMVTGDIQVKGTHVVPEGKRALVHMKGEVRVLKTW